MGEISKSTRLLGSINIKVPFIFMLVLTSCRLNFAITCHLGAYILIRHITTAWDVRTIILTALQPIVNSTNPEASFNVLQIFIRFKQKLHLVVFFIYKYTRFIFRFLAIYIKKSFPETNYLYL